jgi:hypothetical protein
MQFVIWTDPFMHLRDNPRLSTKEGFYQTIYIRSNARVYRISDR